MSASAPVKVAKKTVAKKETVAAPVVAAPVVLVLTVGYEHVAKHSFKVFGVRLRIVNVRRVVTFFEHVFFVSN
jgi:hypothetical protein